VTVICWGCLHHARHYDRGLCATCHAGRYGPGNPGGIRTASLHLVAAAVT
jgi:hypothetical protein